ncbi:hypothetical protein H0E87_031578, partial [Populus deltoides]
ATVSPPPAGNPLPVAGNGSVFHRLGPQIPPSVEPRKNFRKHIRSPPKGKEALAVADVSALSPNNAAPPNYAGVANSIDTWLSVPWVLPPLWASPPQKQKLQRPGQTRPHDSRRASPPSANVPSNGGLGWFSKANPKWQAKGEACKASPCAEVAND